MRGRETSLLEGTETGEWREGGREGERKRGREGGRERGKGFSATKVTADLVLVFGCRSRHK